MRESEQLSDLLGQIYDAALDHSRWQSVVEGIGRFVPGVFVNLFSQDVAHKTAQAFFTYGIEPHFLDLYFKKYIHINPVFPSMLFFEEGRILTEEDVLPISEFRETLFFKEWIKPQGLIESMASVLEKSATSLAGIAVARGDAQGPVDEQARRRMELVVPHIRRSLVIGKVIDLSKTEAGTLADALDGLAAGMFIVDAAGRVVHANASALTMLSRGSVARMAGGRLSLNDGESAGLLSDVLSKAERGDAAIEMKSAAISVRASDGERYVAHVLPLTGGVRRKAGTAYSAIAAVFISKAKLNVPHPLEALAQAYDLTPGEMRVLTTVVHVSGVPEAVPILGISETTVKTHLARIFAKTGAKRQADLVKIVAAYVSPLS